MSARLALCLLSAATVLSAACGSGAPASPTAPAPQATAAASAPTAPTAAVSPGAAVAGSPGAASAPTPGAAAAAAAPGSGALASSPVAAPSAAPAPPAAAAKPAAATSLKGAYSQASSVQGALYVGREKSFFANHGLDVQLSQVGGPQQVAALISGDIQFGALGANEIANADLRGADLVLIATCSDLPIFSLFVNKKYPTMAALAGQSIGVTSAGSATDAAAHLFLKQFDLLDKVQIIAAGGTIPSILAAMDQGNIAGGVLSPPVTARAEESGYAELVNGARLGVPMNHSAIAVSRAYLRDHTEDVKNLLRAYQEAWTFSANPANKADVVAILGQYTQSDERLAEIGYQAMVPVWTANKTPRVNPLAVANLLQVSGVPEAATAQPEQFLDDSLIDAIAPPG